MITAVVEIKISIYYIILAVCVVSVSSLKLLDVVHFLWCSCYFITDRQLLLFWWNSLGGSYAAWYHKGLIQNSSFTVQKWF